MKTAVLGLVFTIALLWGTNASAQQLTKIADQPGVAFAEASGAFGFQFGEQSYVPEGDGSSSRHPITNGFSGGVTAGYDVLEGLSVVADWEYTKADSRNGEIINALDEVEGAISYHTIVAGLRSTRTIGPGHLTGELAVGVVLPFETELRYRYAPAMAGLPEPVTGSGTKIDEYNLGFGGHGQLGYQLPLYDRLYMAAALRVKTFQSNNNGKQTRLDNFVVDFSAPQAANMEIDYDDDGGATPQTYSVQDVRFHLALGFRI